MSTLPPELQADATLGRYADVEALARGHLATKAAVGAPKLPTADTALDNFEAFHAVRPGDAAAYAVEVPEGYPATYADGFRKTAHDIGLHPSQAAALVKFNNEAIAAETQAAAVAATAELDSFKAQYVAQGGNFDANLSRVAAMVQASGLSEEDVLVGLDAMQKGFGAAPAMKLLFAQAERFGEPDLPPIPLGDGSAFVVAGQSAEAVATQRRELQKNPEWVKKASQPGTPEQRQFNALVQAEARAASKTPR
jgi:hypothetical protein